MMLLLTQFAAAQNTFYVLTKDGTLTPYESKEIFFGLGDKDIFTFEYGEPLDLSESSFTITFNIYNRSEYQTFSDDPRCGLCYSDFNPTPTVNDSKIEKGPHLTNDTIRFYGVDPGTTYYYRAYVTVDDNIYYGDIQQITTPGTQVPFTVVNGHKFVDLGLPSGTLWATCNIGARVTGDYGNYYAWGENRTKYYYDWDNYKFGTSSDSMNKYNDTDSLTDLECEDDIAYNLWGDSCRMPTAEEMAELINDENCKSTFTYKYTSGGKKYVTLKVTSRKNGNYICFPNAGYYDFDVLRWADNNGRYLTRTVYDGDHSEAKILFFLHASTPRVDQRPRYLGTPVRPVAHITKSE